MAKKPADVRPKITLACTQCKERNYITKKNRRNDPDRHGAEEVLPQVPRAHRAPRDPLTAVVVQSRPPSAGGFVASRPPSGLGRAPTRRVLGAARCTAGESPYPVHMPISEDHVGRSYPADRALRGEPRQDRRVRRGPRAMPTTRPTPASRRRSRRPPSPSCSPSAAWDAMFDDPELDLSLSRTVHVDQRFAWQRPLRAGDEVTATLTIEKVRARGADGDHHASRSTWRPPPASRSARPRPP